MTSLLFSFLKDLARHKKSARVSRRLNAKDHLQGIDVKLSHSLPDDKNKRVLNVGGNNKAIPLPSQFSGFEHWLLDIDPRGAPDIVCDARELDTIPPATFDAVYCSHNLEHYYRHDVPKVLSGFRHVLRENGFAYIRVPDIGEVMRNTIESGLDIDDILYESPAGPIMVLDVLYGYSVEIEESGQDFFAHKTGFTENSLRAALGRAGFSSIFTSTGNLEVTALAFKATPDEESLSSFGIANYNQ